MLLLHVQLNLEMILSQAQKRVPQHWVLLVDCLAPPQPLPSILPGIGGSGALHPQ
jgi:hypothetical protein